MSWMFGLFRLALSLGFFPCFDELRSLDRPLARAEADCSCPIQTVGYQCPGAGEQCERVGVDFNCAAPSAEEPQYTVELRQTGKRDCTLTWPRVTLRAKQRALVSTSAENKSWLMSLHLREVVEGKAFVDVGLIGRGANGDVVNYKGAFAAKLGVCNLTALGGHDLPEPLAVSICVKKPELTATTLPMPRPMPEPAVAAMTSVAPVPAPPQAIYRMQLPTPVPVMSSRVPMPAPVPVAPSYPLTAQTLPYPAGPYFMPAPMPVQPCVAVAAPVPATKVVSLLHKDGKSSLTMKTAGLTSTGKKMTIETPYMGKVTVAAGKNYVHLKGQDFTAMADKVEVCYDHVKLCGHVKLTCEKIGVGAEVKAECLSVKMHNGHFVELMKCECPAAGCCPVQAPCSAAKVLPNRAN